MHIFKATTDLHGSIPGVVEVSASLRSGNVHPREILSLTSNAGDLHRGKCILR